MRVLITGITGLLGGYIAKACYEEGHTIIGLHRRKNPNFNFNFPIEWRFQDLKDEIFNPNILDTIDAIIHCAADTRMGSSINQEQDLINIFAVAKLVDLACANEISRFILISSSNTFQVGTKQNPGTEKTPLLRNKQLFNYANSKIAAEMICRHAAKEQKLNTIILNPTFMIGGLKLNVSSNKLIHYILKNQLLIKFNGAKNFVDIKDVAQAAVTALSKGRSGENYLLSNQLLSFAELIQKIKNLQGKEARIISIPNGVIKLAGSFLSFIEAAFRKPINFNRKTADLLLSEPYFTNVKAKEELDFNPRPLDDTLKDMVTVYEDSIKS